MKKIKYRAVLTDKQGWVIERTNQEGVVELLPVYYYNRAAVERVAFELGNAARYEMECMR